MRRLLVIGLAVFACTTAGKSIMADTKIVLLGTGTPNAEPDRSGPAVAIVVNGTPYLVDCGPGIVRRATAARDAGVNALGPENLKHLFVTHLHSDHTLGYADLIFTPWGSRDGPLEVYGPDGIEEMTAHILAAYEQDIQVRLSGLQPIDSVGYQVNAHVIEAGVVYQDSNVTVEAFSVRHGAWPQAFGFVFRTPDRTIVLSGDTAPTESAIEHYRGCDVLIHEVYSQAGFERRDPVWQRYHAGSHTSSHQLAEIAARTRPGLLILAHQLYWGTSEEELLSEIRDRYDGEVVSGHDLDVY